MISSIYKRIFMPPVNPFPIVTYSGPDNFCDRKQETSDILSAIKNGRSLTMYSIRRMGKTGLIMHVLQKLSRQRKTQVAYVDIFDTIDDKQLVNKLCSAILFAIEKKENKVLKTVTRFFGKYRPKMSFDSLTGNPMIELDIVSDQEVKLTLDTLMKIIEEQKGIFVIAIDEFQQINYYPKSKIAATIRSYIQTVENLRFIFSGSEKNLLVDMFSSPKQALFRKTQLMPLGSIAYDAYAEYISTHFRKGMKKIPETVIDDILVWTDRHTYYTQYLCHRLYERTKKRITQEMLDDIKYQILKENEGVFYNYRRLLTHQQWQLLLGIGKDGAVDEPTSKIFIERHSLGSHSTVRRSLQSLEEKQLIYADFLPDNKKPTYKVYDLFLWRWIEAL